MLALLFLLPAAAALSLHSRHDDHDHSLHRRLPSVWHQPRDHPVHNLFRRADTDGQSYPEVGSPTWASAYPTSTPDTSKTPQEWTDALNAAIQAGKIPNIPQSTNTPGTNPVYPDGVNPNSPEVCSGTYKCRNPEDTWDAPDGIFATNFDDGPLPETSDTLYGFLQQNNVIATHFMIGVNILNNPTQFQKAVDAGHDLAVHTWTHPYMTTLSNADVLAQLGWTMQIIHDSTGGRVPKYWRPPTGDSDNRVKAIAKEVFGLHTIYWNQDTEDWSLTTGGTTMQKINSSMEQWITGPKSPGLIILEHELSDQSVQAFMDAFPVVLQNGWKVESVARIVDNGSAFWNAASSNSDDVTSFPVVNDGSATDSPDSGSSASGSATASGSSASATGSASGTSASHSGSSSSSPTTTAEQQTASHNSAPGRGGSLVFLLGFIPALTALL